LACADLDACDVSYALVGGLAVSARSEPRFTRDLDLAVAVAGDPEAERLVGALMGRGYEVLAQVEQEQTGRLATARLLPPRSRVPDGVVVDLLFASSGLEPELVAAAERLEIFPGVAVPVAVRAHLIALKILAADPETRPQDRIDALNLIREASAEEIAETRSALELITSRDYQRDKNLARELECLLGG
jgi:hypothetical protein